MLGAASQCTSHPLVYLRAGIVARWVALARSGTQGRRTNGNKPCGPLPTPCDQSHSIVRLTSREVPSTREHLSNCSRPVGTLHHEPCSKAGVPCPSILASPTQCPWHTDTSLACLIFPWWPLRWLSMAHVKVWWTRICADQQGQRRSSGDTCYMPTVLADLGRRCLDSLGSAWTCTSGRASPAKRMDCGEHGLSTHRERLQGRLPVLGHHGSVSYMQLALDLLRRYSNTRGLWKSASPWLSPTGFERGYDGCLPPMSGAR